MSAAEGAGAAQGAAPPAGRVWDTRDVGQDEAFGYYREGICQAFMELVPEAEAPVQRRFRATVHSLPAGVGALNRVRATSHEVRRGRREIARAPAECFYLNYQTAGLCEIAQSGHAMALRPGEVGIFDSTIPFVLEHRSRPSLGVGSFFVPRQALLDRLGGAAPEGPVLLSQHESLGRLIAEAARSLEEGLDWMPDATAARVFAVLLDLTALALDGRSEGRVDRARSRGDAVYLALRNHVDRHLADPALGVASTAAAVGISERYLHRLFEARGTSFCVHLGEQRQRLAAARLRQPALAHLPIATIAYDCGFRDLSHFGRAFKARFGTPPGEWRRGES